MSTLVGDQLYLLTTMLYTSSIAGAMAYDQTLPKTGATVVHTGAMIYGGLSVPIVLYSLLFIFFKSLATQAFVYNAFLPYFVIYSSIIGLFSYDYFTQYYCGQTFTNSLFNNINLYICGQVTGYQT